MTASDLAGILGRARRRPWYVSVREPFDDGAFDVAIRGMVHLLSAEPHGLVTERGRLMEPDRRVRPVAGELSPRCVVRAGGLSEPRGLA